MKKLTKKDLQNLKQRTLIEEFHIDHYGQSELDFEIVSFYFETDRVLKFVDLHYSNRAMPKIQVFKMPYDYFLNNEMPKYDFEDPEKIKIKIISKGF